MIIINVFIVIVNALAFYFGYWCIGEIYNRLNNRLDKLEKEIQGGMEICKIVYVNQLSLMKERLVREERFEEAIEIDKLIREEIVKIQIFKKGR